MLMYPAYNGALCVLLVAHLIDEGHVSRAGDTGRLFLPSEK